MAFHVVLIGLCTYPHAPLGLRNGVCRDAHGGEGGRGRGLLHPKPRHQAQDRPWCVPSSGPWPSLFLFLSLYMCTWDATAPTDSLTSPPPRPPTPPQSSNPTTHPTPPNPNPHRRALQEPALLGHGLHPGAGARGARHRPRRRGEGQGAAGRVPGDAPDGVFGGADRDQGHGESFFLSFCRSVGRSVGVWGACLRVFFCRSIYLVGGLARPSLVGSWGGGWESDCRPWLRGVWYVWVWVWVCLCACPLIPLLLSPHTP